MAASTTLPGSLHGGTARWPLTGAGRKGSPSGPSGSISVPLTLPVWLVTLVLIGLWGGLGTRQANAQRRPGGVPVRRSAPSTNPVDSASRLIHTGIAADTAGRLPNERNRADSLDRQIIRLPQGATRPNAPTNLPGDTVTGGPVVIGGDTLQAGTSDSAAAAAAAARGDLQTTVTYQATDSIVFDVPARSARLYGASKVVYGAINLEADRVAVDWTTGILDAEGVPDTTGRLRGKPVFAQGSERFEAERMRYNFKTRRGLIRQVVTTQGEGYIHGEVIKRRDERTFFVRNAQYTTCNLAHPHFHIQSTKLKMIPERKIISGPFNLHVADVPTPLGFAFGFFPIPKYRSAGLIIPTYGESGERGFFLRNGGLYLPLSPYFDLTLLGEIYSRGGWGLNPRSTYRKRYGYSGNIGGFYNRRTTDLLGPRVFDRESFWIDWTHTPETKGRSSRFSANVQFGSNNHNQQNAFLLQNYVSTNFASTVSYSKQFVGTPLSLAVTGRTSQNVQSRTIDVDLPAVSFQMARVFPFQRGGLSGSGGGGGGGGSRPWYEQINVSYTLEADHRISNQRTINLLPNISGVRFLNRVVFDTANIVPIPPPVLGDGVTTPTIGLTPQQPTTFAIPFKLENLPELLRGAQIGATHNVPISTTLRVFRHFNVTPALSYQEVWYRQRLNYTYDPIRQGVLVDTLRGLSRLYAYNASAAVATQIYGTFFVRRWGIEAIRHRMNPSLSMTVRPDFGDPRFGFTQRIQVDSTGRTLDLSRYAGFARGGPQVGRQGAIGLGVSNSLEMKVRERNDTTGRSKFVKRTLIDNLSFGTSYNLAADSFNLAPVSVQANTRLFERFIVNVGTVLDPYAYEDVPIARDEPGFRNLRRRPALAIERGQGLGQFTSGNLSVGVNLNPTGQGGRTRPVTPRPTRTTPLSEAEERELEFIQRNPQLFVDFNVPWTLTIQYNALYQRLLQGTQRGRITHNMQLAGDIRLSEKWKIGATAPYDFQAGRLGSSSLSIYRDLHCWEMRLYLQFAGNRPMYTFDINVKASILQDLKLSKRNSFYDR